MIFFFSKSDWIGPGMYNLWRQYQHTFSQEEFYIRHEDDPAEFPELHAFVESIQLETYDQFWDVLGCSGHEDCEYYRIGWKDVAVVSRIEVATVQ